MGRHLSESFFSKVQQQAEAIAVYGDRIGARLALPEQAVS
jgi:hypothetical protein